jgi:hypothetical protein
LVEWDGGPMDCPTESGIPVAEMAAGGYAVSAWFYGGAGEEPSACAMSWVDIDGDSSVELTLGACE